MELDSIHAQHRKQIFLTITGLGLFIMAGFTFVHYIESNAFAMWVTIAMSLLTAGAVLALQRGTGNRNVYRFVCGIIGIGLFSIAAFTPNHLYYHAVLPLVMFCFLGQREGMVWSAVFFIAMASLLLGTELPDSHTQETEHLVRFFSCYLFISIVAWSYEELQRRFYGLLETQNEQLQQDKVQLNATLNRIRETERQLEQTNIELQDKTQLMETVFNSMSEGVVVADATGRQLVFNSSAEQITGMGVTSYEPSQWAERYGLFFPDKKTLIPVDQNPLARAIRGESVDGFEAFVRNEERPEGIYVSATGRPIRNQGTNEIKAGVVVFRDVTQQKKTEAQLEQTISELQDKTQLMETVFNSMQEGVLVVDQEGRQLFHNPSSEQICGMGMTPSEPGEWAETYGVFYPDEKTYVPVDQNPLVRAMQGESVDDFEAFVRNEERPEGIYVSATGRPIRSPVTNEIKAGVVVFRDVTQQKKTEAQLEQTISELQDKTQLMETVFNSMSEGVVVGDATGRLFFNPSAEHMMGMEATDISPDQWSETYGLFYPDGERTIPFDELPLSRALCGEATDSFEAFVCNEKKPDGIYVNANARPILSEGTNQVKAGVVVFRDVTQQKKAEARLEKTISELRDQSQLMEAMFNSVSDGVVVTDTDGQFLFVNPRAESIVGMGATDGPADQWSETYGTFYPDGKTLYPSQELPLMRAMRGQSSDDTELLIRNPTRPEGVCISVNARPLQDDFGKVKGGIIVLRDITKLKKTETTLKQTVRSLQDQRQLMETVFNSISDGVIAADETGKNLVFNRSARNIADISAQDVEPAQRPEKYGLFRPDGKALFPAAELPLIRAIRGEATDEVEMFIRNEKVPKGIYTSVSGRPLQDEAGLVKGGVVVFRDVTAIKEAENRLQQTADRLQTQTQAMEAVFNSISDGVVAADENGNFTIFNPSAERIVGIGATDTGPDQWSDRYGIFFPDRVTPFPTEELPLVLAIHGQSSDEVEMFLRNPRVPEGVYISVSGRPLRDDSGTTKGGVIVLRDVTERMLAEEALTQAFSQGRLEIVDTILHNIGNAINSVSVGVGTIHEQLTKNELVRRLSGLAKAIEAHRDDWIPYLQRDPQGQKVLPFILALAEDFSKQNAQFENTVKRVQNRVDHIVDIIRTERSLESEQAMARKDVNLQKTIAEAVKLLQDSLARRDVQVHIDCQHAPKEIRIQESKFHQMLVNLIKNAMEAIDDLAKTSGLEGQPRIQVRAYVQEEFLVLEVTDNGIGIERKNSRVIFTAGYTTKEKGSGLGLHSTANFVIGSGGQIYPLSDGFGKGTTMRVNLRLSSVVLQSKSETSTAGGG